ncbi:hypothetical protein [Pseudobacillus badius]|uniref:hypothetical protein n=1 Tax=Bacillus badius TaxID=1455 RepID=UPI0007B34C55|nr:hypothetical protein [Bacillus badius]KZR60402.1 hypothetical protein A3781_09530 [Bacillus badius]
MAKQQWEPCPRCGGKKVQPRSGCMYSFALLAGSGCMLWIGIFLAAFFLPLGIIVGIGAGIGVIFSFVVLFAPRHLFCLDCNNTWKNEKKPIESE